MASERKRGIRLHWIAFAAAVLAVCIAAGTAMLGEWRGRARFSTIERQFPDSPRTYGQLEAGAAPRAIDDRSDPPGFSWVGRVDPGNARYVASRRGPHFWPIDSPEAVLIRAEDFVGYETETEARANGKIPAK